jgi:outer membrane protein assembly factor BamA
VFRNGGWTLYRTEGWPGEAPGGVDSTKVAMTRSVPDAIQQDAGDDVIEADRPYKTRLTPEYAVLGGLYIGNGGAAGSGQLLLGDMLGNHYLLLSAYLRSQIDQSEFLIQYADLGQRWQWGIAGYQFRDELGLFTAPDSVQYSSLVRAGVQGSVAYPFDRFRRVEFSLDLQTVNNETANLLFSTGQTVGISKRRVYYTIPGVALVKDNAAYSGFTPIAGGRWRLSLQQALGNVEYSFGVFDWRRYLNLRTRSCLALRVIAAGSEGPDKQILRIGGPDTYRGADYGEMIGSRVVLANMEFRFPIIPTTELLRGVAFVDWATAWSEGTPRLVTGTDPWHFELDDLEMAVGFGFRAYVGLPLRFDAALPTDLRRHHDWRTMFAIGYDF